jgi:hypothetical protein
MLAEDALLELARLASKCDGPVIELGPYIGGSTCALAAAENTRVITVELGGANREHAQLPTDDTIADLEANLARTGLHLCGPRGRMRLPQEDWRLWLGNLVRATDRQRSDPGY